MHEADRDGNPNVFNVERNEDGLWLNNNWAKPTNKWNPDNEFVFCFRKYVLPALTKCGFSFPDYSGYFSIPRASYQSLRVLLQRLQIVYLI